MLILNEAEDAAADIYTDHAGDLQGELDDLKAQEEQLEQVCCRTSFIQAAIWKCDNVPQMTAADVKAQVEQKGLERRAAVLDANATRIMRHDSIYGHRRAPHGNKGAYKCTKCWISTGSHDSPKWDK